VLFEVGPTINACTRGLWVYPTTFSVKAKDGTQLRVLFVDSEGLGAVGSAQQHDLQVFSISMLIRCPPAAARAALAKMRGGVILRPTLHIFVAVIYRKYTGRCASDPAARSRWKQHIFSVSRN
jgi:hypothetical protein